MTIIHYSIVATFCTLPDSMNTWVLQMCGYNLSDFSADDPVLSTPHSIGRYHYFAGGYTNKDLMFQMPIIVFSKFTWSSCWDGANNEALWLLERALAFPKFYFVPYKGNTCGQICLTGPFSLHSQWATWVAMLNGHRAKNSVRVFIVS